MASPERVGKLRMSPQASPQSMQSNSASPDPMDPYANLKLQLDKFQALLAAKTAKLDALDVDEGNCMSRLAALDMARRRFTMEPREGVSPTRRRTSVSTRARAASGAYGFSELARSFRTSGASSEGSDSSEVERIRASGEEDRIASVPEEHDGRPDGPSQRESLATSPASGAQAAGPRATQARGSGDSASVPRRAEKAKKPMRRRLSTTTSLTRPSEIPGNRAIRLERKTPGESLGFVLKTVKIATVDPDTGEPTGHFVDPTFVAEVGPEGLAYKSGMRAGDHILEIDGEACQTMKHEFVVRLLMQNQGTVSMVVRYTSDYRRTVLHRRLLNRRSELAEIAERFCRAELQERELEERIEALKKLPPGIRFPVMGSEPDLLMANPLGQDSKWAKDLPKLVVGMLDQWKREREFWIDMVNRQNVPKNALYDGFGDDGDDDDDESESDDGLEEAFQAHLNRRATLESRRDSATSGGSTREDVMKRTSIIGSKVLLDLHEEEGRGSATAEAVDLEDVVEVPKVDPLLECFDPKEADVTPIFTQPDSNPPDAVDPDDPAHTWV